MGAFVIASFDVLYPLHIVVLSLHAVVPFSCFLDASSLRVQWFSVFFFFFFCVCLFVSGLMYLYTSKECDCIRVVYVVISTVVCGIIRYVC
jgi:hypothetical protein